jgi:GntR family transcriptional regulator
LRSLKRAYSLLHFAVLDVWHTSLDQDGEPYELTRFMMRGDMTGLLYDVPVE